MEKEDKKKNSNQKSISIMLVSEEILKEDWLSEEDNKAWKDL